jgi:predicted ATPase
LSNRLLELSAGKVDDGLRLQAHHSAWTTCLFAGEAAAGREHTAAGRRLYDPERHRSHRLLFGGHDPGVCARNMGGQVEWALGYPEQALASSGEGIALAEQIAHPFSLEISLVYRGMLHLDRGEPERALQQLSAMEALVAEQRLALIIDPGFVRGAALLAQGAAEEAITCLRAALETKLGRAYSRPYGLAVLAKALVQHGEPADAFGVIGEALETMKATGHRQWEPELHRLRASILLDQNRIEESEQAFKESLGIALRRQMKAYELRAAISLARLWGEAGRRAEARELLAPVYGWFTEGFDTADLKEAAALLADLA